MKVIVIEETPESVISNEKGSFGIIILEFELPKEAMAFQRYQRAVKQPDGIRELARFCEKNNIRDLQMKTHEPNQGEKA